ncbi:MAG: hypothetical protein CVV18_08640 [Gammaproteobacteria bacterium HGW-Gammaproteobacteria-8]|nr:MAG: hypothetical protein CVV18_08640 [Gammaproteobacteria bacterium HGW-Gammaproteobacteria-8]
MALLILVLSTACTSPQQMSDAVEARASWQERAATPVERFRFSTLRDWHPLERDWVMLRFGSNRNLAVQVRQPCIAHMGQARSVSLVQTMPNSLNRIGDRIRIDEWVCVIEQMLPVANTGPDNEFDGSVRHSAGGLTGGT